MGTARVLLIGPLELYFIFLLFEIEGGGIGLPFLVIELDWARNPFVLFSTGTTIRKRPGSLVPYIDSTLALFGKEFTGPIARVGYVIFLLLMIMLVALVANLWRLRYSRG